MKEVPRLIRFGSRATCPGWGQSDGSAMSALLHLLPETLGNLVFLDHANLQPNQNKLHDSQFAKD
jgi:hypothetical protein